MKRYRVGFIGLLVLSVLLVLTCLGAPLSVPLQWGYHLMTGWAAYLTNTLPRVSVRWEAAASMATYLLVFVVGSHLFLKWLYRETTVGRRWRVRWTLCGTGIVLLLFVAGVAAVGVSHQAAWLATSPEPLHRYNRRADRIKCSNNLRQIGLAAIMYAQRHDGRFPDDLPTLLATEEITSDVFICPADVKERAPGTRPAMSVEHFTRDHCSYIYLGRGLTQSAGEKTVIAYEPLFNHDGQGINLLFADAHTEWLDREAAVKFLDGLKAGKTHAASGPAAD